MKAWVGFEKPTEGSVLVQGIDPWLNRRGAVEQVGYVPQTPSLYRDLSAEDHLALAATLRRAFDRQLARQRLTWLGIPLNAKPPSLSGGQQAQLCLAIALGTRAPVLILDEPLASLDPLARREFLAIVTESVASNGSTAILSSHIITDVEASCDRVLVLEGGRKLLDATISEAVARHVVLVGRPIDHTRIVGRFNGPAGEPLTLARRDGLASSEEREASLEEVVIGYLAAGRSDDTPA
jgi:ABC-2 type transport system ATP-binding protein